MAFAYAVRRTVDPQTLIDRVLEIVADPKTERRDVIAAVTFLHGSAWKKPPAGLELSPGEPDDDEDELLGLSIPDLRELAALDRARLAVLARRQLPTGTTPVGVDAE